MKLPENTLIASEKLTKYLLIPKKRNDKSEWFAKALPKNATLVEKTEFGQMYEIRAKLIGPNGKILSTLTVWMTDIETGKTRFITMYPDKTT